MSPPSAFYRNYIGRWYWEITWKTGDSFIKHVICVEVEVVDGSTKHWCLVESVACFPRPTYTAFCFVMFSLFFHLKYFLQKENWQERRRSHPLIKCALSYCSLSMNVDKQQIWPLTTDATICPCDIYIYITFHSLELISQKLMWRELWPERSCEMSGRIIFRHGVD